MSKPRKKSKKILFILEIVVLLLFIGGLFVYGQISAKLDKIDIQETDLADQDIVTNDQAPQMTGYTTYADRKSTRLNSSHKVQSRMPSSA